MTRAEREAEIKSFTDKILKKLSVISKNLDKIITEISTSQETSNLYWTKMNQRIRAEYEAARSITQEFLLSNFPEYYNNKVREELTRIKNKGFNLPKTSKATELISSHGSKQSLKSLLNETITTYRTGFQTGQQTITRLASLTQQINIQEKKIEKAIADGYLESGSVQGSKKKLRNELLKKATDGKYITVIDKNGNPENWKVDTYAEMVTRTKLMEASTQAVVDTANAVGADLVQVSVHNTQCAICAPFEGKIFSLSGSDPDFPMADSLSPWHPNCQHSETIVFKDFLQQQGTLSKYIDFSNGETDKHPTRTEWIPISKRKLH